MKVTFYSPGTFVSEITELETDLTDPSQIAELARGITERHNSKPYGFRTDAEPRKTYFPGGTIKTIEDYPDTPENRIIRSNMVNNNMTKVIENTNSWKITLPLDPEDVVLEWVQ